MEDFQLDLVIGEGPAARSVRIDLAYLGWGDNPFRSHRDPSSRAFRHTLARGFIHRRNFGHCRSRGAAFGLRSHERWRFRDRQAIPRNAEGRGASSSGSGFRDRRWLGSGRRGACRRLAESVGGGRAWAGRHGRATLGACRQLRGGGWRRNAGCSYRNSATPSRRSSNRFLIQQGLLMRTPRGRMLADSGYRHLGPAAPRRPEAGAIGFSKRGRGET